MVKPWLVDGQTFATDGSMAVVLDEAIEGVTEPEDAKTAKQIRDVLKETNRLGGCRVDLAALKAWCGGAEEAAEGDCEECKGKKRFKCEICDGTGRYECGECGHEAECQDCDGAGKTTCECCNDNGKAMIQPKVRVGKFFDVLIDRNKMARALACVSGDEARATIKGDGPIRLFGAGWSVLLMPMSVQFSDKVTESFP